MTTAYVLLLTLAAYGGGVAIHSHEFTSQAACELAAKRYLEIAKDGPGGYRVARSAVCIPK